MSQRDILLAGIDQPAVDLVRLWRRAHAEHAVLGMENDLALGRHVIGDLQRRADAEIDIPAFGNVAGETRGHLVARQRLAAIEHGHRVRHYVTVGSP